jgi:hypothetical protein
MLEKQKGLIPKKYMISVIFSKLAKIVPTDGASMTQFSVTVFVKVIHFVNQRLRENNSKFTLFRIAVHPFAHWMKA